MRRQVGNKKQVMPPGFSLGGGDGELFFWVHNETEMEGVGCWDKWRCYRSAWKIYREGNIREIAAEWRRRWKSVS